MRKLDWTWIGWQVGLPLFGPILLSAVFALFWWSLAADFTPEIGILIDVTPWALATYALTLIGSALRGLWVRLPTHPALGAGHCRRPRRHYLLCVHGHPPARSRLRGIACGVFRDSPDGGAIDPALLQGALIEETKW